MSKVPAADPAEAEAARLLEGITALGLPCPECSQPTVGARVYDAAAGEAFVGAACVACDAAFRVASR